MMSTCALMEHALMRSGFVMAIEIAQMVQMKVIVVRC